MRLGKYSITICKKNIERCVLKHVTLGPLIPVKIHHYFNSF